MHRKHSRGPCPLCVLTTFRVRHVGQSGRPIPVAPERARFARRTWITTVVSGCSSVGVNRVLISRRSAPFRRDGAMILSAVSMTICSDAVTPLAAACRAESSRLRTLDTSGDGS